MVKVQLIEKYAWNDDKLVLVQFYENSYKMKSRNQSLPSEDRSNKYKFKRQHSQNTSSNESQSQGQNSVDEKLRRISEIQDKLNVQSTLLPIKCFRLTILINILGFIVLNCTHITQPSR